MAKKNNEMNVAKALPRVGSTFAVAMAVTMAMSNQAYATEVVEAPAAEPAPVAEAAPVIADPAPAASSSSVQEVSGHNEAVAESNSSAAAENTDTGAANADTGSANESTASGNDSVPSGNETTSEGNDSTASGNEATDSGNQEALESTESTEGSGSNEGSELPELPEIPEAPEAPESPDLPEIPEVPEAPETPELDDTDPDNYNDGVDDYNDGVDDYNGEAEDYNEAVGEYNDGVGEYNDQVNDYNDQVDDYNQAVGEYNDKVDEINQELADQYEEDHQQWEQDQKDNQKAQEEYAKKESDYKEAEAKYLAAKDAYDQAYSKWEKDHAQWEENKKAYEAEFGTQEDYDKMVAELNQAWEEECERLKDEHKLLTDAYTQYLKEKADYEQYQKDLEQYQQDKEVHDQLVTENDIYDDVLEYNEEITRDNQDIETENKKLTSDLDTGAVANLEKATSNANVNKELEKTVEGKALLATLSEENRNKLAQSENALAEKAKELDEEAKKNYALGSEDYAAYLQKVKDFNAEVEQHNTNLAAYNNAVAEYNKIVDAFNDDNKPVEDSSTNTGSTGTADWGNVPITQTDKRGNETSKPMDHIDVKYQAAASKDVIQENGETKYTDTVTSYTVTGVYATEADKNTTNYGVSYDTKDGVKVHELTRDDGNAEYGGGHPRNLNFDPLNGTISFYVTLQDSEAKHDIFVSLDENSTYAEGSFYKANTYEDRRGNVVFNDTLASYRFGENQDQALETVKIGDDWYYNISGHSVFVISALACPGTSSYFGNINTSNLTGLDLILNLQTMIKVHQSDNAQRITYQGGYLQGKLAYAEAPADPGEAPTVPDVVNPPEEEVQKPDDLDLPKKPNPDPYVPFGEKEPEAPEKDYLNLDPGPFNETPVDPFTDPEPQLVQLSKLDTLEKLDTMDELDTLDYLQNKLGYKMFLVIPEVPREEPTPIVISYNGGEVEGRAVRTTNLKKTVKIVDEKVPLAKAPNTGDLSGIWAVISGLSLGGISLLNRKRKEEE